MQARRDAATLLAEMTLAEKIGQLNLLSAGEGLATGTGATTVLGERLDQGAVGAVFARQRLQRVGHMGQHVKQVALFGVDQLLHLGQLVFAKALFRQAI